MKLKAFFIVFEALSSGEKIKIWRKWRTQAWSNIFQILRMVLLIFDLLLPNRRLLVQVNNANTRTICGICYNKVNNKDTKTMSLPSLGCFFVKFEQISLIFLEFSLLTWNKQVTAGYKIAKKRQQNFFLYSHCYWNLCQAGHQAIN